METTEKKEETKKPERIQDKNLKPMQKGDPCRNPAGRGKGVLNYKTRLNLAVNALAEEQVRKHNAKPENKNKQITIEDVDIIGDVFKKFIGNALSGDGKAVEMFMNRTYGMPKQVVKNTGEKDMEVVVKMAESVTES